MVYCHVGELHYYTGLITASKTFYSGIVKDLVSKLAARKHIVTKFFSGSYSVLSMFLHFLNDFSNVFSSNPNRCIIGEINLLFWYFSFHQIIGTQSVQNGILDKSYLTGGFTLIWEHTCVLLT